MTAQTSKPRKLSPQQQIIELFLLDATGCNWSTEMKFATRLVKEYDFDWLMSLNGRTKVISLTWFFGENGKKFLNDIKRYQSLNFEKQEIVLEDNPVAPQTDVSLKPTSLKEFLNIFNNK